MWWQGRRKRKEKKKRQEREREERDERDRRRERKVKDGNQAGKLRLVQDTSQEKRRGGVDDYEYE